VRENFMRGSVRGASENRRSYHDCAVNTESNSSVFIV